MDLLSTLPPAFGSSAGGSPAGLPTLGLVVLWSRDAPGRAGFEILLLLPPGDPGPWTFGRGDAAFEDRRSLSGPAGARRAPARAGCSPVRGWSRAAAPPLSRGPAACSSRNVGACPRPAVRERAVARVERRRRGTPSRSRTRSCSSACSEDPSRPRRPARAGRSPPMPSGGGARRVRHRGRESGRVGAPAAHRGDRAHGVPRAHPGRERHRQGAGRAGHPRLLRARPPGDGVPQRCHHPRRARGGRALRQPPELSQPGHARPPRPRRRGGRIHALPRRVRRAAAEPAGPPAPRDG